MITFHLKFSFHFSYFKYLSKRFKLFTILNTPYPIDAHPILNKFLYII